MKESPLTVNQVLPQYGELVSTDSRLHAELRHSLPQKILNGRDFSRHIETLPIWENLAYDFCMSEDVLLGANGEGRSPSKVGGKGSSRPRKGRGKGKGGQQEGGKINPIPGALRLLRKRLGLTQEQAAEKAHISPKKISNWENGQRANEDDLRRYIEAMGFSLEDFARFQIEYLSDVYHFKNEWERDLDVEDQWWGRVSEVRRLLARNREYMPDTVHKAFVHHLEKCEKGGRDLIHELRLLREAIEDFQYTQSRKKSRS